MVNTRKISGRMKELGLRQQDVAHALGVASPTISLKINGIRPMTLDEAERMADLLKIQDADFGIYFFSREVAQRNNE